MKRLGSTLIVIAAGALLTTACKSTNPESLVREAPNSYNNPLAKFGVPLVNYERYQKGTRSCTEKTPAGTIPLCRRLRHTPWSDTYWPAYGGYTAQRWQTRPNGKDYKQYLYTPGRSGAGLNVGSNVWASSERMSPAEKYDLLTGKLDFPLASEQLRRTQSAVRTKRNQEGEIVRQWVPSWFGLCHGWAPAAALNPAPQAPIRVKSATGQCLKFYPSDIKALLTLAYADGRFRTAFLGQRCNPQDNANRDSNGRIISSRCRDTNPAAFHVVITSLISRQKPLLMDVTFDDEVWNQPVVYYRFKKLGTPQQGAGPNSAPGTKFRADIELEVGYMLETSPRQGRIVDDNYIKRVTYKYELELDGAKNIIGGEWKTKNIPSDQIRIPDFLWSAQEHPVSNSKSPMNLSYVYGLNAIAQSNDRDRCGANDPNGPYTGKPGFGDDFAPDDPGDVPGDDPGTDDPGTDDPGTDNPGDQPGDDQDDQQIVDVINDINVPHQPPTPQQPSGDLDFGDFQEIDLNVVDDGTGPAPIKFNLPVVMDPPKVDIDEQDDGQQGEQKQQWVYRRAPESVVWSPFLDPGDKCELQSPGKGAKPEDILVAERACRDIDGCIWSNVVQVCVNDRSDRCGDYPDKFLCPDTCEWTGSVCSERE